MKSSFAALLIGFLSFDIMCFFVFPSYFTGLFPKYKYDVISNASRGYPRYHFMRDGDLGFDIRPNFETSTKLNPPEYGSYLVWGNKYGCFDNDWELSLKRSGIYMAGDSFTWGYSRHNQKFTTLIQKALGSEVYACGVTHTGQRHQFQKFLRLYDRVIKPELVIVNVTGNDIENDFFFPISTVVEGFLVENIKQCGKYGLSNYSFERLELDEMKRVFDEKQKLTIRSFLRQYSVSANILALVTQRLRQTISMWLTRIATENFQYCYFGSDFRGLNPVGEKYATSDRSQPNKQAIVEWITHSRAAGYDLIFSLIPGKLNSDPTIDHIADFIEANGGVAIEFNHYILEQKLDKDRLYFRYDGHFSEQGNIQYSNFIMSNLAGRGYVFQ